MMRNIVGMFPDPFYEDEWSNSHPLLRRMSESIQSFGWQVVSVSLDEIFNSDNLLEKKIDVLHLHWPVTLIDLESVDLYYFGLKNCRFIPNRYRDFYQNMIFDKKRAHAMIDKRMKQLERLTIPVVWEVHDIISHHLVNMPKLTTIDKMIYQGVYELSKGIIIHEKSCLNPIVDFYGINKNYEVCCLGDYSVFHGSPISKDKARNDLGLPGNGKILSYIGTARVNRNPKQIIKTFKEIASPIDLLIIAGQGVGQYIKNNDDFRIKVFDGLLSNDTLRNIFCASDFVINDASKYLTSAVVRTAMSYGIPVIVYPYGSAIDMAKDAAIFIKETNNGLETAINYALKMDNNQYINMVNAAWQRNKERSWDNCGKSIVELYEKVSK